MTFDITTDYMGLKLRNPIVPSASPLTGDLDTLLRLQEAGAGAVVMPSLFEEQIEHEALAIHSSLEFGAEGFAEAAGGYFPEMEDYNTGPRYYLGLIEQAKAALEIPVIPSLNGTSKGGWTLYARLFEDAGADALELNIYFIAADSDQGPHDVEEQYIELVDAVRRSISIPLAVKIGPFFSSIGNFARRVSDAGADGLVLFNRFYQPDIDLDTLEVTPNLVLSSEEEMRLVLRWMAILKGRVDCSLAATTGVHTAEHAIKLILAGADITMMAAALLKHGPEHVGTVLEGVRSWFEDREYKSVEQAKGSLSQQHSPDPAAFERANYMKTLVTWSGGGG
ncbi:MAG: dihydroorotate dehydrogenase-like protein [Acidimicrobiia bacterium]